MAGLKVKMRVTRLQPEGNHRLQMWVEEHSEDIEPEIFVYQRYPAWPGTPDPDDRFVNVASVADMADYPVTAPTGDAPFFRLTSIDLIFRSVDLMDTTIKLIKEDIEYLLSNLKKIEEIYDEDTIEFNPSELSSSSSSSS